MKSSIIWIPRRSLRAGKTNNVYRRVLHKTHAIAYIAQCRSARYAARRRSQEDAKLTYRRESLQSVIIDSRHSCGHLGAVESSSREETLTERLYGAYNTLSASLVSRRSPRSSVHSSVDHPIGSLRGISPGNLVARAHRGVHLSPILVFGSPGRSAATAHSRAYMYITREDSTCAIE